MIKKALLFLLTSYKKYISPFLPPACRFYPSCSEYMFSAISVHGVIKGLLLGTFRLLRCQPLSKGGFDYVPEKNQILKYLGTYLGGRKSC